ncbi:MAG: hypothetical protein GY869_28860, partial [Planctomycetes bacterium]|nr:hypothetical protein [Planctomycetota bacterium]
MIRAMAVFVMVAVVLVLCGTVRAQFGTAITYQGKLSNGGAPANGKYDLEFVLYDALTGGSQEGTTQTKEDVNVYDGYFTVTLDFGSLAFNGDARWLQIGVRPYTSTGNFATLSPRQNVSPIPYAMYAETAESVVGGIGVKGSGASNYIPKFLDLTTLGNSVIYESGAGNIGIGTTTPDARLDVQGGSITAVNAQSSNSNAISATSSAGGGWAAVRANATAPDTYGIWGSSSNYVGGRFESDTGIALETSTSSGHAATFMGGNVGIGTSTPTSKLEVTGSTTYNSPIMSVTNTSLGDGMWGESSDGYGVVGKSSGPNVAGVLGIAKSSLTWGVYGYNPFPDGIAIRAYANNGWAGYFAGPKNYFQGDVGIGTETPTAKLDVTGSTSGLAPIMKVTNTGAGTGVWVESSDGYGVWGETSGTSVGGVVGIAKNSTAWGVSGVNQFSDGIAIRGSASSGWAGYFEGKSYFSERLGIGTTTPDQLLHVYGDSNPRILVEAPAEASPEFNLKRGTETWGMWMNSNNDLDFFNNGSKVTFAANGNVGIGNTNPQKKLHISGGGILLDYDSSLTLRDGNGYYSGILGMTSTDSLQLTNLATNGEITFYTTDTPNLSSQRMVIQGDGIVGLNNVFPAAQLDIHSDDTNKEALIAENVVNGHKGHIGGSWYGVFATGGEDDWDFYAGSTSFTYGSASSIRWK